MKFLIIFALAVATASAFDLRSSELKSRSVVMPTIETDGRITKGNTASVGQFPYQVGLSLRITYISFTWCGGSLIGNQWVLTAAHCTEGVAAATVYLGSTERTTAQVTYTVPSSDFIIHADWDRAALKNDISLIKIPSTTYTSLIQAVPIPAIASSYSTFAGETAIATGWGRISDTESELPDQLQWAEMPIITNTVCSSTWKSVTDANICVSTTGGVSTCNGDSGGPLVLSSTRVQIGLTSYGSNAGCGWSYPAVFTRLTSYLDWIHTNTGISY